MKPMTPEETKAQNKLVSQAARATDYFTEDELEAYAEKLAKLKAGQFEFIRSALSMDRTDAEWIALIDAHGRWL